LKLFLTCGKNSGTDSQLIARVDKSLLTEEDANKLQLAISNKSYSKSDVIASWVDRELLYLAAKEKGIEEDQTLKSQIDIYKKDLFGNTYLNNFLSSKIKVDNSEIRSYYDKNRVMFRHENDGAKIMHFFTNVDSIAGFIVETLNNSSEDIDRKALLSNYEVDVTTVEKGSLIDVIDDAIFSTNRTNIVIGPIQTDYGYHVVEVLERYSNGTQVDIDEAYDEIYQSLYNQKKSMLSIAFLDSLRNHYNVKIYLENN
jgi:hypothetical protein